MLPMECMGSIVCCLTMAFVQSSRPKLVISAECICGFLIYILVNLTPVDICHPTLRFRWIHLMNASHRTPSKYYISCTSCLAREEDRIFTVACDFEMFSQRWRTVHLDIMANVEDDKIIAALRQTLQHISLQQTVTLFITIQRPYELCMCSLIFHRHRNSKVSRSSSMKQSTNWIKSESNVVPLFRSLKLKSKISAKTWSITGLYPRNSPLRSPIYNLNVNNNPKRTWNWTTK